MDGRGDADLEVEEWLWTLREQAEASGGAVYHLLGNHEVLPVLFRYFLARVRMSSEPDSVSGHHLAVYDSSPMD